MDFSRNVTTQGNVHEDRFLRFLATSIALHVLFLLFMNSPLKDYFASKPAESSTTVVIELEAPSKSEKLRRQVVNTDLIEKAKEAAPDAFLGQQTQVVQRQTKAQNTGSFRQARAGGGAKSQSTTAESKPKALSLGKLGVGMNFKPMGHLGPPGQAAANNDYLDAKEGAQTLLNTKEFAFFAFYQRVRQQLEQFWEPTLKNKLERMIERGRSIASDREHATKLQVVMNNKGEIVKILIDNTSGLVELDQVAIDAFNKAGPFPNPPAGMVEKDGTVRVDWEFVLRT